MQVTVLAPVNQPRQGYVVYYDTRRAAARRRLDRTLDTLREAGVPATGVVVEADPVSALRDAIDQLEPDEIIVSTHPQKQSGWLRRNMVDQMRRVAGDRSRSSTSSSTSTRSTARRTSSSSRTRRCSASRCSQKIRERAAASPAGFLIISPQGDSDGSYEEAERRLLRAVTTAAQRGARRARPDLASRSVRGRDADDRGRARRTRSSSRRSPAPAPAGCAATSLGRLRADTKLPVEHVEVDVPAAVTA